MVYTEFQVFSTTFTRVFDTQFVPIRFEYDLETRTADIEVPGAIRVQGEPMRNPITGDEHHAQIHLPDGFEYRTAELASGSIDTEGAISLHTEGRRSYFCPVTGARVRLARCAWASITASFVSVAAG